MADQSFVHMTQYKLYSCCALFLAADNSMPTTVDPTAYSAWLDNSAQALGYTSWLDFYHTYEVPGVAPKTPEVPTQTMPDEIIE
jgi:hypothetical protein